MADKVNAPPTEPSGGDPTPLTDNEVIQNWRRSNYIQYSYHGRTLDVNINDFLHYSSTGSEDYANAWLSEDQVTLPLALIADNKGRPDILILESAAASCLASIGLGLVTPDDFAAAHLGMFAGMKDESINWIIAPCNDGMTRQAEITLAVKKKAEMPVEPTVTSKDTGPVGDDTEEHVESDALDKNTNTQTKEGAVSNTMKEPKSDYGKGSYQGMHWGVMIIDKARNEARWLDGAINLTRKNGKVIIRAPMHRAGWVAGKVLCGYDRVMQLPRGQFTATTLKHTPHDYRDNSFRGDVGCACGPWVIAIIQYILDNAEFLTAEDGLKGTFASNRRRGHVIGMAFDSLRTRTAAQEMVKAEYEREVPSDALPCRLTLRILKIICNSDNLRKNLDSFLGNGRTPPGGAGVNSGKKNGGNDPDDDETGCHRDTDVLKSTLMDIVRSDPGAYSHLNTNDEKRELARINQIELEKNLEKAKAEKEKAEREKAMEANPFGTGPHSKNPVLVYPDGFSKDNLPDFGKLWSSHGNTWTNPHLEDLFDRPLILVGNTYQTVNSVLHRTYKGTFSNEPEKSLRNHHYRDDFAFNKVERDGKWTAKQIADRLNETYVHLEIPFFAALSEEDIGYWVSRLPQKVGKILSKADKSIDYGRARGMLHRMYVGELDQMTADDIAAWRQADPSIPTECKQHNEAAMVVMKMLYEGPDVKHLPWLLESPLHWPSREYRAKHGEKRKRGADEEENDEDESDDTGLPSPTEAHLAKKPKVTEDPKATDTPTPDEASQPAKKDPKSVDWLNITDVNLAQYITEEIRTDRRIGNNPNNYSYRAILFVQHGGTFKDASQTPHTDLWVRDTNVFRHGLDVEDATIDLRLRRDPEIQLEVVPGPERILERLAAVYEPATPATVPEPETVTAPVKNKANMPHYVTRTTA
jgi:hypothetical protein